MNVQEIMNKYEELIRSSKVPIIRCNNCGHKFVIIRTSCPMCNSENLSVEGEDEGTVYSYTIIERGGLPSRTGLVVVDVKGIKVKANFQGDLEKLKIGIKVKPKYVSYGNVNTIVFTVT